jgi:hypothetical protein
MWLIEIKQNGKVLRIDDDRNVTIKTTNVVGQIKLKNWNQEWLPRLVSVRQGNFKKQVNNKNEVIQLNDSTILSSNKGFLDNEYSLWLIDRMRELKMEYSEIDSLSSNSKTLKKKALTIAFLKEKLRKKVEIITNTETGQVEYFAQSSCGTACDDFGAYYSENGDFLRSAGSWRPIQREEEEEEEEVIPTMCADIYKPVCGSDGLEYGNECYMKMKSPNTKKKNDGKCWNFFND